MRIFVEVQIKTYARRWPSWSNHHSRSAVPHKNYKILVSTFLWMNLPSGLSVCQRKLWSSFGLPRQANEVIRPLGTQAPVWCDCPRKCKLWHEFVMVRTHRPVRVESPQPWVIVMSLDQPITFSAKCGSCQLLFKSSHNGETSMQIGHLLPPLP